MAVSNLIREMKLLDSVESDIGTNERRELLQACERLKTRLETPFDSVARLAFSGHQLIALRLAVDLKLFDTLDAEAKLGGGSVSIARLAAQTSAEPLVLTRILRFLIAMEMVHEIGQNVYAPTPLAASFVSSSPLSAAIIHSSHFMSVMSRLPEYFDVKGWKSPHDAADGPFQFAMGSDEHYFDFLSSNVYYGQAFNKVMTMSFRRRGKDWFEFFPVKERLLVSSASDSLLVDIGGSQGEDLKKFHKAFLDLPGKLILQDLAAVIDSATELPPLIEAQRYNFFDEQPIKGAKGYFLRTILHDWPDKQASQILGRVREAMGPDSILLINELMLPESGVLLSSALADMQMMGSFASLERTESQWKGLLESAGFELEHVWLPEDCDKSPEALASQAALFEARRK